MIKAIAAILRRLNKRPGKCEVTQRVCLRIKRSIEGRITFIDLAQSVSPLYSEQEGKEKCSLSTSDSPVLLDVSGT